MSKSKSADPKGGKDNKPIDALVKASAKLRSGVKRHPVLAFTILACLLALPFLPAAWFSAYTPSMAALYLFGNDGRISGRQSGSVKTRNGVERIFVVPRLVRNAFTGNARAILSATSSAWNTLSATEVSGWNNATGNFKSDRFGRQILIKGKALFVERNANLIHNGQGVVTSYPGLSTNFLFPGVVSGTFTTTAGVLTTTNVSSTLFPVPSGVNYEIWATAPQSPGTTRPKLSAYRFLQYASPTDTAPVGIGPNYGVRFGNACQPGQQIGVYIKVVDLATGQAGQPAIAIITAT